jgi:hypothetical protein
LILGSLGAEITLFMNIPPPLSSLLRYGSQRQIKECNYSLFSAELSSGEEQYGRKFSLKGVS